MSFWVLPYHETFHLNLECLRFSGVVLLDGMSPLGWNCTTQHVYPAAKPVLLGEALGEHTPGSDSDWTSYHLEKVSLCGTSECCARDHLSVSLRRCLHKPWAELGGKSAKQLLKRVLWFSSERLTWGSCLRDRAYIHTLGGGKTFSCRLRKFCKYPFFQLLNTHTTLPPERNMTFFQWVSLGT